MSGPESVVHHRREVSGVPVHHFPTDDQVCEVSLSFAVGLQNESLPTMGALHAVEHLVMHGCRDLPIEINARVVPELTTFVASGSARHAAEFLRRICTGLASLPLERLDTELRILAAEDGDGPGGGWDVLWARHGLVGLGLVDAPGPVATSLPAAAVSDAGRRWFTADNAFLAVVGPWPEGLDLPLARGPRPPNPPTPVRLWGRPSAATVDGPACTVSLILPPRDTRRLDLVAVEVLARRCQDALRHDTGLAYVADHTGYDLPDGRYHLIVYAEPPPESVEPSGRALVSAVRALAATGPSAAEVTAAQDRVLEGLVGRAATVAATLDEELARRCGVPLHRPDPGLVRGVTADELSAYLRPLADELLLITDDACRPLLDDLGLAPVEPGAEIEALPAGGQLFRPSGFTRLISKDARQARVVLYDWGLGTSVGGVPRTIRWSDVVGVLRTDGDIDVVFGADGASCSVSPHLYRGGKALVEAVRRHVPAELFYTDVPPETSDHREK